MYVVLPRNVFFKLFRASVDLSVMEPEVTHTIELPLSDDGGVLVLLLTISGSALRDTVSDLATFSFSCEERRQISKKYVRVLS